MTNSSVPRCVWVCVCVKKSSPQQTGVEESEARSSLEGMMVMLCAILFRQFLLRSKHGHVMSGRQPHGHLIHSSAWPAACSSQLSREWVPAWISLSIHRLPYRMALEVTMAVKDISSESLGCAHIYHPLIWILKLPVENQGTRHYDEKQSKNKPRVIESKTPVGWKIQAP